MPDQPLTTDKFGVAMDGVLLYILGEGWKEAKVGDGAKWIWNLSNLCFPTAQEIVD